MVTFLALLAVSTVNVAGEILVFYLCLVSSLSFFFFNFFASWAFVCGTLTSSVTYIRRNYALQVNLPQSDGCVRRLQIDSLIC